MDELKRKLNSQLVDNFNSVFHMDDFDCLEMYRMLYANVLELLEEAYNKGREDAKQE